MIDRIKELDVKLVVVDFTVLDAQARTELARADRSNLPVNLVYPPDYPARPAVMMNELITPDDALFVLDYLAAGGAPIPVDKVAGSTAGAPGTGISRR